MKATRDKLNGQAATKEQPTRYLPKEQDTNSSNLVKNFLSYSEAAEYLSISKKTLYKYLTAGIVTGHKLGGKWRFTEKQLLEAIKPGEISKYSKTL